MSADHLTASPINLDGWHPDPNFPFHPIGSKPKKTLIAPPTVTSGIIRGHTYLYKLGVGWKASQVWSEYIAYRLAALLNLDVARCFIGINGEGETGALIEFFFGFPLEESPAQLVHGAEVLAGLHRTLATGRPNNILENARVCRIIAGGRWIDWWATVIAFDALIGNTDRHTENWGFLVRRNRNGHAVYTLAPLYDHGTSLGYQIQESALSEMLQTQRLHSFVDRGRTHLGWDMVTDHEWPHFDLCSRCVQAYPSTREVFERFTRFEMSQVERILSECVNMETSVPFSPKRAEFVLALLRARRERLVAVLER